MLYVQNTKCFKEQKLLDSPYCIFINLYFTVPMRHYGGVKHIVKHVPIYKKVYIPKYVPGNYFLSYF